ncbi:MAG: homoserine dehydrogenase, partial [Oscillospiraceae bacterium]|nr:homoserine dehydrogenase [Oscillospiraceae bacterium]
MSKFAVLGHGVVGSGTVELFLMNKELIKERQGIDLELGYILDIRDFPGLPYSDKFTKNIDDILNDADVKVVAEVMGGVHPAFEFVKSCLEKGKSVCTSNKELVAKKGAELLRTAKEHNCNFMFEASTGGAIPVLRPMHTCLAGNEITAVAGILNGTTNFILTKMIEENMSFDDALKTAQANGYAEKDPTADVEGHDACRKICILSSLAFGRHVYPDWIYCEGITGITLEDAEYAAAAGYAVKLIGSASRVGDKILPMVAPRFVPASCQLHNVSDVFNAIMVYGNGFDEVMFYGKGAGKLPTASAVLGDVIDCAKKNGTDMSGYWEDSADSSFIADYKEQIVRKYIRTAGASRDDITAIFGNVEFLSRANAPADELAFITSPAADGEIDKLSDSLGKVKS